MMSPDELVRILAPLAFRIADKLFKFISWLIIIVAIRYATTVTNEPILRAVDWIATLAFGFALVLQALNIALRDPSTLGLPLQLYGFARPIQFLAGVLLLLAISSPALLLDQIADGLAKAQIIARAK